MTANQLQVWVGIVGSLATVAATVLGLVHFQSRRDRAASVGSAFRAVVDGLASDNSTHRMAAAVLIRRFFDKRAEQGVARKAYAKEAVAVITGLLRGCEPGDLQKALADSLGYAPSLAGADLQRCKLVDAYLGTTAAHRAVHLEGADLFEADLTNASLRDAEANDAKFYHAILHKTVLRGANLTNADFREADLTNADFREAQLLGTKFEGAILEGAKFAGSLNIPPAIASQLDPNSRRVAMRPATLTQTPKPVADGA